MMYTAACDGDTTNYFTEIGRNKKVRVAENGFGTVFQIFFEPS